jgi:imidazolonepropionase-like amidohydrolase
MAAAEAFLTRLGLAILLMLALASSTGAAEGLAIVGATVFEGTGAPALTDAVIVVLEEKVRAVGPRSRVALPKGIPYLDGRGLFVLPGLVGQPSVAAALRAKVRSGATFESALADALRAAAFTPSDGRIEPGGLADLVVLDKDPRANVDHLGSVKWVFVKGREVVP